MKRIALILAATALAGCGDGGTDGGMSSARVAKSKLDYVALSEMPKDAATTTAEFLSVCEAFVTEVDSIPRNEGDPNPMEVMRAMGASEFCGCVGTEMADIEDDRVETAEDIRNGPTRYMAHHLAKAEGTVSGRPNMSSTVTFGRRIDTCFKSARAAYAG